MSKFKSPDVRYHGPAKFHGGPGNKPIDRIVLHSTVGPSRPGSARGIAEYFKHGVTRPSSAHYVVDASEVIQCVFDGVIAYHDGQNVHEIGIEMCDMPSFDVRRWGSHDHAAVLNRTAHLTAQLCLAYNVPPYYRSALAIRMGRRRGVTTHDDESKAFRKSSHWDPGAWPRRKFMKMVRAEMKRMKAAAK